MFKNVTRQVVLQITALKGHINNYRNFVMDYSKTNYYNKITFKGQF